MIDLMYREDGWMATLPCSLGKLIILVCIWQMLMMDDGILMTCYGRKRVPNIELYRYNRILL